MFSNILVPTDGSKLSQRAVNEAIELARVSNAKLTALHVYPRYAGSPYGTFGPAADMLEEAHKCNHEAAAAEIFAAIKEVADAAGVPLESKVVEADDVYQQIIAVAGKKKCDLICMASHGRRGLSAVVLGSETHKVLTHSKIPVLVLR